MRAMMSLMTGLRALLLLMMLSNVAQAQSCRLALVLALDVSGSVDPEEYAQQISGLAAALNHPEVRGQILDGAGAPVSLAVFEWSSRNHQYIIQPWIVLDSDAALDAAIARIRSHRKVRAGLKTALGTALTFGQALLRKKSHCWYQKIDVSGDGKNNIGPTPEQIYQTGVFDRITVNALVIGGSVDDMDESQIEKKFDLLRYYKSEVIHGPEAFAMIANGYRDYADAMRRKLKRELQLPIIGAREF